MRGSWQWVAAWSAFVALITALLWFHGSIFRESFLREFGLSPEMFPANWHASVSRGGIEALPPMLSLVAYVFSASAILLLVSHLIPDHWLGKLENLWVKNEKTRRGIRWFLTNSLFVVTVVLVGFTVWVAKGVLGADASGRAAARSAIAAVTAPSRDENASTTGVRLGYARIQRKVADGNGYDSVVTEEGHLLTCNEKYCVLVKTSPSNAWYTSNVPLEKIIHFDSYVLPPCRLNCVRN